MFLPESFGIPANVKHTQKWSFIVIPVLILKVQKSTLQGQGKGSPFEHPHCFLKSPTETCREKRKCCTTTSKSISRENLFLKNNCSIIPSFKMLLDLQASFLRMYIMEIVCHQHKNTHAWGFPDHTPSCSKKFKHWVSDNSSTNTNFKNTERIMLCGWNSVTAFSFVWFSWSGVYDASAVRKIFYWKK